MQNIKLSQNVKIAFIYTEKTNTFLAYLFLKQVFLMDESCLERENILNLKSPLCNRKNYCMKCQLNAI